MQIPQASGTHLSLISGMLMQLAAATATKGTHLPISGGAFCQQSNLMYAGLQSLEELPYMTNQTPLLISMCVCGFIIYLSIYSPSRSRHYYKQYALH
jgi:hypothetical protein